MFPPPRLISRILPLLSLSYFIFLNYIYTYAEPSALFFLLENAYTIHSLRLLGSKIITKLTQRNMASWKKTITSPFRKACTFLNQQPRDKKSRPLPGIFIHPSSLSSYSPIHMYTCCFSNISLSLLSGHDNRAMDLQGEVMACAYEDVQVMWSILDKSKSTTCNIAS